MWQKNRGILLRAIKHNDKSVVVNLFTENRGMAAYIFYLGQGKRKTGLNTLLQPLTLVEFEDENTPSSPLGKLREVSNMSPYTHIPFSPVKTVLVLFLAEFLLYALREETCDSRLFNYLFSSMRWLDNATDFGNFHLVLILGLARYLGINPNAATFTKGSYLDLQSGCFSERIPNHANFLNPELSSILAKLTDKNFESMEQISLNRVERNSLVHALNDYFRLHLPGFPILKSVEVLKSVLD